MSHTHMSYVTSGAVGSSALKGFSPLLMSRNLFMCVCVLCVGGRVEGWLLMALGVVVVCVYTKEREESERQKEAE